MDLVGPYRLDALVGRGTTGAVWRATRQGPVAHEVAVKRARATAGPEAADRLRREAAILAELDHPHIVRVVDVLDAGGDVAIVMSLARGGSLHDLLAERGRLPPGPTVAVLAPVADALGSAHRRGVLHGDVKPANILFTSDGEPLLGDFGVAQHLRPGPDGDHEHHRVEGTTGYVDPDLVATGRAAPHGDVYGLAVVAYLCLAGRPPHPTLAAADAGDHPPLADVPGVPPALAAVVEQALARDPEHRPTSAEHLARALRAAVPPDEVVLPGPALATGAPADDVALPGPAPGPGVPADEIALPGPAPGPGVPADEVALPGLPLATGAAADLDRGPGTRAFGPRPPRREEEARRGRPVLSLLGVVALLVAAAGGGLWGRSRLGARPAPAPAPVEEAAACPDVEPVPVPPGAEELHGDLNGDGCPVPVVWDGQVMRFRLTPDDVEPRTFDVRVDGDRSAGQLVLGDWDCDGRDTPALYRPARGLVAYFPAVPGPVGGEVVATVDTAATDGRAVVRPGGADGCDTVVVEPTA